MGMPKICSCLKPWENFLERQIAIGLYQSLPQQSYTNGLFQAATIEGHQEQLLWAKDIGFLTLIKGDPNLFDTSRVSQNIFLLLLNFQHRNFHSPSRAAQDLEIVVELLSTIGISIYIRSDLRLLLTFASYVVSFTQNLGLLILGLLILMEIFFFFFNCVFVFVLCLIIDCLNNSLVNLGLLISMNFYFDRDLYIYIYIYLWLNFVVRLEFFFL